MRTFSTELKLILRVKTQYLDPGGVKSKDSQHIMKTGFFLCSYSQNL